MSIIDSNVDSGVRCRAYSDPPGTRPIIDSNVDSGVGCRAYITHRNEVVIYFLYLKNQKADIGLTGISVPHVGYQ